MDRITCRTSPGDVNSLLGNAALEHVDMLVDKGSSIYNTMNMKSGINNTLLRAANLLLQSFMKLDDRGGFFKQADMEQGLLFAIRARGSEERWRGRTRLATTPSSLSGTMLQRTMCLTSSCPSAAAFGTAIKQWHGMRMAIASLPIPRRWCFRDCCLAQGG